MQLSDHISDVELNEYLDDETSDRIRIESHVSSCADCAARLALLQDLFSEIESLPDLELTRPVALRFILPASPPAKLPRSLTLAVTVQAMLAVIAIIIAAPFVMKFLSAYSSSLPAPSLANVFLSLQAQWTGWLDTLSTFRLPSLPEIPVMELSSLFVIFTIIGVSLLWLIGNGLLLRNHIK